MPTVMFQEHVGDNRAWRSVFDGNTDNENDLLISADFADEGREREFVEVVRKVMEAAGVSTLSVKFLPTEWPQSDRSRLDPERRSSPPRANKWRLCCVLPVFKAILC
jgi:hypothetical protein